MKPLPVCICVLLTMGLVVPSAFAQNNQAGPLLGMWDIKTMTDQACVNIAKRYNLAPDQEVFTRALMAKNVKTWLSKHGKTFEKLLPEILKNGLAANEPPPPEMVKSWAARAKPMFDDAKSFILEGNKDWAEILNEDQKRIHQFDLEQMEPQFKAMDDQFARWEEGKWQKGDFIFPQAQPANPQVADDPAVVNPPREHFWKIYVDRYIERFNLNDAQKESAYGILADCRARATKYRESHQKEIDDATENMQEMARKKDTKGLAQSREELGVLNKPISDLFTELKTRLEKLPTEAQKGQYEEGLAAQRQKIEEARLKQLETQKAGGKPEKILQFNKEKEAEEASKPETKSAAEKGEDDSAKEDG